MSIFNGIVKLAVIGLTNNHNSENNNMKLKRTARAVLFVMFLKINYQSRKIICA